MAISATKNSMTKKQTLTLLPFESEVYPVFPDIPHLLLYYSRGPVSSAGGADRNLDTLTSKNDYAKRSFIFKRTDFYRTHII